jgi:proline iminopeptidase
MDPLHMAWMAHQLPDGRSLICPHGSHLAQYDDPEHYFPGLIRFIHGVDDIRRAMR